MSHREYCLREYKRIYARECGDSPDDEEIQRSAQKKAIRDTILLAMDNFPDVEPSELWSAIYSAHIHRKSGISDDAVIDAVISSDNSWKKSSGHAFEEVIKLLANESLGDEGITFYLQKELSAKLHNGEISNPGKDLEWLKGQIKASSFDLYATLMTAEGEKVFGCIQSKTSIRDRVTRDREPSLIAMKHFFWSIGIVLDGQFLKLPKFRAMVNGGTESYEQNGWHTFYVFSRITPEDRIFPIGDNLINLITHAKKAAESWRAERQWMDHDWHPSP